MVQQAFPKSAILTEMSSSSLMTRFSFEVSLLYAYASESLESNFPWKSFEIVIDESELCKCSSLPLSNSGNSVTGGAGVAASLVPDMFELLYEPLNGVLAVELANP